MDARNASGFTPLMKAALQGRTKCAKILLFAGKLISNDKKEDRDSRFSINFRRESDIERSRERIESGTVGQILREVRVRRSDRKVRQASTSRKIDILSVG